MKAHGTLTKLLSLTLSLLLLFSLLPIQTLASDVTQSLTADAPPAQLSSPEEPTVPALIFVLNGGAFVTGNPPASELPAGQTLELPGEDDVIRTGYRFGGWYDNRPLDGDVITSVTGTGDEIALYARWIPRYYTVTIPDPVQYAQSGSMELSADCYGFYAEDELHVSVSSGNNWSLRGSDGVVDYTLSTDDTLANGDKIADFAESGSVDLGYELNAKHGTSSGFTDQVTFTCSFSQTYVDVTLQSTADASETVTVPAGTRIAELPEGVLDGSIFLNWCYDADLTRLAESTDEITADITLYAKFLPLESYETIEHQQIIYNYDIENTDFYLTVHTKRNMAPTDVKKAIELINVNHPDEGGFYTILGSGDTYTIHGIGGFTPGNTYKLILHDDDLCFDGYQDKEDSPREYHFSIYKDKVINIGLDSRVGFIPLAEVRDLVVNGNAIPNPTVDAIRVTREGENGEQSGIPTIGSFRYTGAKEIKSGDIFGIHVGDEPDLSENSLILSDPNINFIEVTSVSGTTVNYRGADVKDVLFTPDVFPVAESADTDGDPDNGQLRAAESWFIYTDGSMSAIGLDIDTTVDIGDFIAFFTGADDLSDLNAIRISEYALINSVETEVTEDGVFYLLHYTPVSEGEMTGAVDTYYNRNVNKDEFDEIVEDEKVLSAIRSQVAGSEFEEKATDYMILSLIQSEDFVNAMEENQVDLSAITFEATGESLYGDTIPHPASSAAPKTSVNAGGNRAVVEIGKPEIFAMLDTNLSYFSGDGLRLMLEVTLEITVKIGTRANIKFVVGGQFQQELRLKIGVDGEAVWDNWGPVPYISDYTVTVDADIYEFTGLEVTLTVTIESSDLVKGSSRLGRAVETAKSVKDTMKKLSETSSKVLGFGDEKAMSFDLAEKYSEMIDAAGDLDWVDLLVYPIMDRNFRVVYVVDIKLGVDFVLSAKVNITVGSQFWFATAKRYVFTVSIGGQDVTHETTQLEPEVYSYSFYAMGMIGVRVGIQLRFDIGLLSTKLDSVGVRIRTGAFFEMYGYFYYSYINSKFNGVTTEQSNYGGALYMELGIFLNITLAVQIGDNALSLSVELYDHQWPLRTFGEQKNVQDFNWKQSELEEVDLKYAIHRAKMPSNLLDLQYLDLKEGAEVRGSEDDPEYVFAVERYDLDSFDIISTNPAIVYEPEMNYIVVNPGEKDRTIDGELSITYKKAPLTLTSSPIQRKIKVHWDNLASGYFIAFDSMDGSFVNAIEGRYGKEITPPEDPVRAGFRFGGWYADMAYTTPVSIPATMPSYNQTLYAKWVPASAVYTIEHYKETLNGTFECALTESVAATTGSMVTPSPRNYIGYHSPDAQTSIVEGDGSTVIRYYYSLNSYRMTFLVNGQAGKSEILTMKFGSKLVAPHVAMAGYTFAGWDQEIPQTVPAHDMTFTGTWLPSTTTPYKVIYYFQNADGLGYTPVITAPLDGTTGATATAPLLSASDFPGFRCADENVSGVIAADGTTVLKVLYDRETFKVNYLPNNGTTLASEEYRYGAHVFPPRPKLKDYAFTGWYTDPDCTQLFDGIMPNHELTLYAGWKLGTGYTVEHYKMNVDGTTYPDRTPEVEYLYVQEDEDSNSIFVPVKSFTGFDSPAATTWAISESGETVVTYYYKRIAYDLTIERNDGTSAETVSRYFEQPLGLEASRTGYTFEGWFTDPAFPASSKLSAENFYMPSNKLTVYAKWSHDVHTCELNYGNATLPAGTTTSFTYYYADSVSVPYTPTYTGHTLEGWYTDPTFTTQSKFTAWSNMPASDLKLYAHWTADSYTITYVIQNGSNASKNLNYTSYTVESPTITIEPAIPNDTTNMEFLKWTVTGGGDKVKAENGKVQILTGCTGDLTLTASFQGKACTIHFDHGNQEYTKPASLNNVNARYGEALPSKVAVPTRAGYNFKGWEKDGVLYFDETGAVNSKVNSGKCKWSSGTEGVTLTAKWESRSYTIKYDTGGRFDTVPNNFVKERGFTPFTFGTQSVKFSDAKVTLKMLEDSQSYSYQKAFPNGYVEGSDHSHYYYELLGWSTDETYQKDPTAIDYPVGKFLKNEFNNELNRTFTDNTETQFVDEITLHGVFFLYYFYTDPVEMLGNNFSGTGLLFKGVPVDDDDDESDINCYLRGTYSSTPSITYYNRDESTSATNVASAQSAKLNVGNLISEEDWKVLTAYCKSETVMGAFMLRPVNSGTAHYSVTAKGTGISDSIGIDGLAKDSATSHESYSKDNVDMTGNDSSDSGHNYHILTTSKVYTFNAGTGPAVTSMNMHFSASGGHANRYCVTSTVFSFEFSRS